MHDNHRFKRKQSTICTCSHSDYVLQTPPTCQTKYSFRPSTHACSTSLHVWWLLATTQVQVLGTIRNISGPTNRRPPNYLPGVKYKHTLSKLGSQVNEARSKRVRVMISTGDVMGDIHAASLVCALQSLSKDLSDGRELEVWGTCSSLQMQCNLVCVRAYDFL